jgi:hypothetical protein
MEPIRKQKRWRWGKIGRLFPQGYQRHSCGARVSWLSSPCDRPEVFSVHFHQKPDGPGLRIVNGFSRLPIVLALFSSN